jgi:hypothetical protein
MPHSPNQVEVLERRQMFAATAPTLPPPSDFVSMVDNKYFPLEPGAKYKYRGVAEDGVENDLVTVISSYHKTIAGITATVVLDRVFVGGRISERTHDFYAQDKNGNVWYVGEDTKEYDKNGRITSTEGSFEHGKNGAKAGIIMEGNSKVGDNYLQENDPGNAEDQAKVEALNVLIHSPAGTFKNGLKTSETSALEPGVAAAKYYAPGIGDVLEESTKGPLETLKLVRFSR